MTETSFSDHAGDPDFMLSLARGLQVLEVLATSPSPRTIADLSRQTALSRAAVRRILYTLAALGHCRSEGAGFIATPTSLLLNHPLVSPDALARRSQPILDRLRDRLGESCSLGVLDNDHVRYVARAEAYRIMSVGLRVGSRLPLYTTSMGRVLLAGRAAADIAAYLARSDLRALTAHSVTDRPRLQAIIGMVAVDGYAIVDQELEIGLRSLAVPVWRRDTIVAALNVGTAAARVGFDDLRKNVLPILRDAASELSDHP